MDDYVGAVAVPLTQGYWTWVDQADAEWVCESAWYFNNGYARHNVWDGQQYHPEYLHRVLTNAPDGVMVDHINHDKLDNRRANLRLLTNAANVDHRRGANANSSTGARGVFWDRKRQRYYVQRATKGQRAWAGYFTQLHDAIEAAQKIYGSGLSPTPRP